MKKWSILVGLFAILLSCLLAFRTIAPPATASTSNSLIPIECAPLASRAINAIPFSLESYSPQALMVRKNVYSLSSTEIASLKKGISAMKALPVNDPTSWTYQAAIHGTTLTNNLPSWNSCQHNTRFFFSWHRMYLYFFERILKAKSGDPSFTLPYWDYQTNPVIPPAYRDNSTGNPLYDGTRFSSMNSGGSLPSSISSSINNALNFLLFYDYQTRIESPHGAVHTSIGGNMGKINTAGRDPVFYLHHANIDRLWEVWLWRCQGRSSPTSSDTTWWNQKYTFFDETGSAVVMTGNQIVDAAAQLNYSYDTPAPYTTTTTTTNGTIPSPGRFEAENYTAMSGIVVVDNNDGGMGRTVAGISNGDWMDYSISIPAAASYRMNFRVAMSSTTAGNLQVRNATGGTLSSLAIPYTGGSNVYTTFNTTVTLPAGQQTLRIYAGVGNWRINWFEIISTDSVTTTTTTTPCGTSRMMDLSTMKKNWYELIKLQNATRLNQTLTQLSFVAANAEGLKTYRNKSNTKQLKLSHKSDGDQLYADIELLKINKVPEGVIEVYLNLPNGTTPSPDGIYFAGVMNLFNASEHIHFNEKANNIVSIDLGTAAAAQGLTLTDLEKSKLTFVVRGNKLVNGKEVQSTVDAQLGTIKLRLGKSEK